MLLVDQLEQAPVRVGERGVSVDVAQVVAVVNVPEREDELVPHRLQERHALREGLKPVVEAVQHSVPSVYLL